MKSRLIKRNGPLKWKTQTNGIPKLQGVFKFKDEVGFPISLTYDIAVVEKGWEIDWIEALIDAARQDKFDSMLREIEMIIPDQFNDIRYLFGLFIMSSEAKGETIKEKAEYLYNEMHKECD